jgi:hypothetical protein
MSTIGRAGPKLEAGERSPTKAPTLSGLFTAVT